MSGRLHPSNHPPVPVRNVEASAQAMREPLDQPPPGEVLMATVAD
ncbi:MAG: hypothetical protein WAT23_07755 [Chromatiaceae bacterium]